MFENAGSKIRVIAYILFWLEIIGGAAVSVVIAIGAGDAAFLLLAPVGAGLGLLIGWLSTIMIHAIADIADKADYIKYILNSESENNR